MPTTRVCIEVRTPLDPEGQVMVAGALWRARSTDPGDQIDAGQKVQVRAVEGLTLDVAREANTGGSKGADSEWAS